MAATNRKAWSDDVTARVLTECHRRCALCAWLCNDFGEKFGQLAHLDHDCSNSVHENAVFLCVAHHSLYDARFTQVKSFTKDEVRHYRDRLRELSVPDMIRLGVAGENIAYDCHAVGHKPLGPVRARVVLALSMWLVAVIGLEFFNGSGPLAVGGSALLGCALGWDLRLWFVAQKDRRAMFRNAVVLRRQTASISRTSKLHVLRPAARAPFAR